MGFIQVSDKFSAAIVVVNGETPEEFKSQLVALMGEESAGEYLEQLVETMKASPLSKAVAAVAAVGGEVHSAPSGEAPSCQHGQKTFLTKNYKNKPGSWKAWACPADRNDASKCELDFIN